VALPPQILRLHARVAPLEGPLEVDRLRQVVLRPGANRRHGGLKVLEDVRMMTGSASFAIA
jgi:hypothetical protein